MKIPETPLFEQLKSLELPRQDFAVFGSGTMAIYGLKEPNDLDLIARGQAWRRAIEMNKSESLASGTGGVVRLCGGEIEIFNAWVNIDLTPDQLIDGAEIHEGIKFVGLETVLRWKRNRNKPKDAEDIARIIRFLEK